MWYALLVHGSRRVHGVPGEMRMWLHGWRRNYDLQLSVQGYSCASFQRETHTSNEYVYAHHAPEASCKNPVDALSLTHFSRSP